MIRLLLLLSGCHTTVPAPVPTAPAADLAARPDPAPPMLPPQACEGPTAPFVVGGRVVDTAGAPLAGEAVLLQPAPDEPPREIARTDADGLFRVELDSLGVVTVADRVTMPWGECVRPPPEGQEVALRLIAATSCPVELSVTDERGQPVEGAVVRWIARQSGQPFEGEESAGSDRDGRLSLPRLPCGDVALDVRKPGLATARSDRGVPPALRSPCRVGTDADGVRTCFENRPAATAPTIGVELARAVALRGRVREPGGSPVVGARATLLLVNSTWTDERGQFELWVPPAVLRDKRFLRISSIDHQDVTVETTGELPSDAGAAPANTWDLTLLPTRPVIIRCAGLDQDRCDSVYLSCGVEGEPPLHECGSEGREVCECPVSPDHPSVVSGGGVSVYVPGEPHAWLDFRGLSGQVSGRVAGGGACSVRLDRPESTRVDPKRPLEVRTARCDERGAFQIAGVASGPWELRVSRPGVGEGVPEPRRVEVGDGVLDLGELSVE